MIWVAERKDGLYVYDGRLRVAALSTLGVEEVEADVREMTREEEIQRWSGLHTVRSRPERGKPAA